MGNVRVKFYCMVKTGIDETGIAILQYLTLIMIQKIVLKIAKNHEIKSEFINEAKLTQTFKIKEVNHLLVYIINYIELKWHNITIL